MASLKNFVNFFMFMSLLYHKIEKKSSIVVGVSK